MPVPAVPAEGRHLDNLLRDILPAAHLGGVVAHLVPDQGEKVPAVFQQIAEPGTGDQGFALVHGIHVFRYADGLPPVQGNGGYLLCPPEHRRAVFTDVEHILRPLGKKPPLTGVLPPAGCGEPDSPVRQTAYQLKQAGGQGPFSLREEGSVNVAGHQADAGKLCRLYHLSAPS